MRRRQFIQAATAAVGAALVVPSLESCVWNTRVRESLPPPPAFVKSIMWGTVRLPGTVYEKCRAIKAAGFDGIEPNSHMDRTEVLDALERTGLRASSVCCSTHWAKPLSHPEAAVRQEGVEGVIVAMEDARAYGTDAVLLVPGAVTEEVSYRECWDRSTEAIKQLLPVAEKLQVRLCIENVWNNFILSPVEACQYLDQFDSPFVKFYLDCGNLLPYGWSEQWVEILDIRLGRIHVKEFSRRKADSEGRWAGFDVKLTEGDVNWDKVVRSAEDHYYFGWMTSEQGGVNTEEDLFDLARRMDSFLPKK